MAEDIDGSDDEHEDDGSEVVASSDGELDPNEYKQDKHIIDIIGNQDAIDIQLVNDFSDCCRHPHHF